MSMTRKPTMADVAEEVGVSPMTVSRAFRDDSRINASTRERIRQAADRLGYVLDSQAAGLSSRRSGFVAMTIPALNNVNYADTARGLTEGLRESGLDVLLGYTDYDKLEEERLIETFLRRRPEAVIITGSAHTDRCRTLLQQSSVPVIEIWEMPDDPIDRAVGFSNAEAGRKVAMHLFEQGYRRMGFIGGDLTWDTRGAARLKGFADTLAELGLPNDRTVSEGVPPVTMDRAAVALQSLLDRWPDTEAVMCVSDLSAFGVLQAARAHGLKVPDDIAIAGFGAYELSAHADPQITTVDARAGDIGHQAARQVLDAIADEDSGVRIVRTGIHLLARSSTLRCQ